MTWQPPSAAAVPSLTPAEVEQLDPDMRDVALRWHLEHEVAHLRVLHPTSGTGSIIEVRTFSRSNSRQFFAQIPAVAHLAAAQYGLRANALGKNVFVGINGRNKFGGKKPDIAATTTLLLDLDSEKIDVQAAVTKLTSHGVHPYLLVVSGNGLHFYVRLRDPVVPATDAEEVGCRLNMATGSDHVFDCTRIARLAGTVNQKTPPTIAYVAGYWSQHVYLLDEVERAADAMGVPRNVLVRRPFATSAIPIGRLDCDIPSQMPEDVEAVLRTLPAHVAVAIRTGERPPWWRKSGNNEIDFWIMCEILKAGHPGETVLRVYNTTAARKFKVWRGGQPYFERTLVAAKTGVARESEWKRSFFGTAAAPAGDRLRAGAPPADDRLRAGVDLRPRVETRVEFPDWDESIALGREGRH